MIRPGFVVLAVLAIIGAIAYASYLHKPVVRPAAYVCLAGKDEVCPADDFVHALDVQKQLQEELREQEKTDKGVQSYEAKQRELYGISVQIAQSIENQKTQRNLKWDADKKKFIVIPPEAKKPEEKKK